MEFFSAVASLIFLVMFEILYFRIAYKYNITDKPNHRSSHSITTIRGGGIIFSIAVILFFFTKKFQYPAFTVGLFLISTISFLDDILTLSNKLRLTIHFLAVVCMFTEWQFFHMHWYWLVIALILVIGTINAYNFMDGINGITGAYSFVAVGTLYYISKTSLKIASPCFFDAVLISLLIFNFFNFRKRAKCFAGDVGSISIAFVIIFLLGSLIIKTHNLGYIFILLVYGLDSVSTIMFRLLRRENIFEAHRSHFYQYLANNRKMPHLLISSGYAMCQLLLNLFIVSFADNLIAIYSLAILFTIVFIGIRFKFEGVKSLIYATTN